LEVRGEIRLRRKTVESSPELIYMIFMLVQFMIMILILLDEASPWSFLLFLMAVLSIMIRWRFRIPEYYMLMDVSVNIVFSYFMPEVSVYLYLFVYYFIFHGKFRYSIIPLFSAFLLGGSNTDVTYVGGSLIAIIIIYLWKKDVLSQRQKTDDLRKRIYELEETQANLLLDYRATEQLTRLTERHRIAEILHDDLGHELTAAHLSLKAAVVILENENTKAQDSVKKSMKRLETGLTRLKESVSQLEPLENSISLDINELIEAFPYKTELHIEGNMNHLPSFVIQLIHMSLKEALTNVVKHAKPTKVEVYLEITETIARLTVKNDGVIHENRIHPYSGLRYMRKRLEAVYGSLSVQKVGKSYMLIVIIPVHRR